MFSISANTMYSVDENGHSLEVSYRDSDGVDVGAYAEGDKFEDVIFDVIDQLDEAIAEFDDDKADIEEAENLQKQIADLQTQIAELQARNDELEQRHAKKIERKPAFDNNLKDFLNGLRTNDLNDIAAGKNKITDFYFSPKWWT